MMLVNKTDNKEGVVAEEVPRERALLTGTNGCRAVGRRGPQGKGDSAEILFRRGESNEVAL
jgi:hypothetical protein